ncbi:MAG: hypothetical protein C0501_28175 [Isosphaera sp.]|nr:hypothetical protein [Isosphaera sp.]
MEFLDTVLDFLKRNLSAVVLALTWAGLLFAWWRARSQWRNREFLGQVNFSLNLFGDTMAMRTLLECPTASIWPNAHGLRLIRAACASTTNEDPFLRLTHPDDRAYMNRAVKNAVSQLCPAAFVAAAVGAPVKTGTFLFAVTCERYEEGMRTIKIRVLLIEQNMLREWCRPGGRADGLELAPFYRPRLRTLKAMYEMDAKARAGGPEELGRVELGVPVAVTS